MQPLVSSSAGKKKKDLHVLCLLPPQTCFIYTKVSNNIQNCKAQKQIHRQSTRTSGRNAREAGRENKTVEEEDTLCPC